ncbi:arabinose-5-phosphate isomerase [Thalassovita gelatinovora]|uniref:KpsF/GutQ family sugar-phosphate isomerase n=1 Tax=Thalassovita gelatinovora TaxID=53501 RepID=UPI0008C69E40|nr:KpsF/GutQ family sugar-phosphate isomerase [Thalassovita gelatinovora]QIZ82678.1 KpsF/GutQ family sugar-phosphate isomerase [Thalassovita gelatinovora]SER11579.1 arabinose-5-phosphate isomerase [Thalassovita gelatinovora]
MTHQDGTDGAILTAAHKVLTTEAEAIRLLSDHLPADFEAAVRLILSARGRVIVSGIGKSGHIGNKIAATLASTGTPSFFVHASEASHGDLGMITEADIVLLISNSGETRELGDVLAHAKRFSIPLIAISSRLGSTLMKAADCKLLLPPAPEACPMGLAPTTSTTLALALGDALAVALMEERDFKAEHFRTFHPGGKLGAQLSSVAQLMHGKDALPLVGIDTPMEEVLIEMTSKGFGTAGVLQGGALAGIVSDGDLRRNMAHLMTSKAGEVATMNPVTVPPDMLAAQALAVMNSRKITTLFVVEDGAPVGILHLHDLLRAGVA